LAFCENKQLKASIKGTSPDGKKTMTSDVFKPDWKSEDPGKVKIDHDGWAKRLQEGVVQVKAYVEKKPNEKPIIDPGFATIGTSPPNFCKYTLTWHADISWWAWFSDYSWHSEKGSWNGRIEVASDKSSVISKSMDCTDYAWYPSIAYNASMTRAQADSWVNQWAINLPSRFREAASEDGKLRLLDPFVPIPPLQVKWQDIGCPPTEGYYCGGTQVYPADYYMSPGDLDADDTCGSSFSKTVTYPWAKADGWIDMGSGNLTWDVKVVKEACPPPSP
jgi:hypothetical protein